jgi:hypothetical protein
MAASPLAAALLGGEGSSSFGADPAILAATPQLQLGQSLVQQGLSTAPAYPLQALARLAQTAAGGYLQRDAVGSLAQAYAHTAENAASTLPQGHPLQAALKSNDPVIRMQGLQAYQKALTLLSEPSNVGPGDQRSVGSAVIANNRRPRSDLGKTQEDLDNAAGAQPAAVGAGANPAARAALPGATAAAGSPGVPLNPPRLGGIESIVGMGPGSPSSPPVSGQPPQVPLTGPRFSIPNSGGTAPVPLAGPNIPNFNDRFSAARPSGAPPTSPPLSPLQGAIDVMAQKSAAEETAKNPALIQRAGGIAAAENPALAQRAGAAKQAEANVEFGDLIKPQASPKKGPGGTEALPTTHGTLVPAIADQAPLPKTPAEAKSVLEGWQKTKEGWNSSLQPGYQAEQRLNTIANVFKTMQTGYGAEEKAHVASLLKSIGVNLPENILGDPAKVETAIHENYVETLQQLKATTPRFTQMEFKALSENKEHPNLQPASNLQMLSEDIGQLRQSRDIPRDFVTAQQHGWRDPQSFEQAWLRQNPLKGYVDKARAEIGPLKGMTPDEVAGTAKASTGPAVGHEHNGWTFKGGDPNSKSSWEKATP